MLPFNLNIIALDQITPLEKYHPTRASQIRNELLRTNHLVNPLLVTRVDNGRYLLLQGINSYQALKSLGITDTVVQVIQQESNSSELMSWSHLVRSLSAEYFLQIADDLKMKYEIKDNIPDLSDIGKSKEITCVFFEGAAYSLRPCSEVLIEQAKTINSFIESYQANCSHKRLYPDNLFLRAVEMFEHDNVMIILPRFTLDEIITLAETEFKFPPDYLNLNLENRVVGLDFPVNVLSSNVEIGEKRSFLNDLIRMRLLSNRSMVFDKKVYYMGKSDTDRIRISQYHSQYPVQRDIRPE